MKKIAFLASLLCATFAMATPTITGMSQIDLSTSGQTDKYVRFVLADEFSDGFDNTWDTPAPNESGIYVYYNGARYIGWASNEYSVNLPLGFYTGENTAYTLKFSNFTGTSYEIYDRVEDYTITVNGSTADYNFTIDESEKNSQINDRFIINYNPAAFVISLTTNVYGWASFSYDANLQLALPAGLKIYTGAFDGDHTLNLNEVNYVKANEGVVVFGAPNTTYYFAAGGSGAYGTNDLKPTSAYTVGDQNVYVLKGENLLLYNGTTPLAANKAYLQLSAASSPKPAIRMVINHTTGVENVAVEDVKAEKFVENGEILIRRGNEVYNLQGQIVK